MITYLEERSKVYTFILKIAYLSVCRLYSLSSVTVNMISYGVSSLFVKAVNAKQIDVNLEIVAEVQCVDQGDVISVPLLIFKLNMYKCTLVFLFVIQMRQ